MVLTPRVAGFPVGKTLLAVRRGRQLWTSHARPLRLRGMFRKTVPAEQDPCLLLALQMIADLSAAECWFPSGTTLQLETWLMGPRLRRRAEAKGWTVEPHPVTWRRRRDLRLAWRLMPRGARRRCRGPFANGSAAMFRLAKAV